MNSIYSLGDNPLEMLQAHQMGECSKLIKCVGVIVFVQFNNAAIYDKVRKVHLQYESITSIVWPQRILKVQDKGVVISVNECFYYICLTVQFAMYNVMFV